MAFILSLNKEKSFLYYIRKHNTRFPEKMHLFSTICLSLEVFRVRPVFYTLAFARFYLSFFAVLITTVVPEGMFSDNVIIV